MAVNPNKKRCKGKKRRTGEPCGNWAIRGRDYCKLHGGRNPVGAENGNFKHGLTSKYHASRIAARVEEALNTPHILDMRSEIALIDARLVEMVESVDTASSSRLWADIQKKYRLVQASRSLGDVNSLQRHLADLEEIIERGSTDAAAWTEIQSLIEQRRRIVDSERKHMIQAKQTMTLEQGMMLITAMVASVREHVNDKEALKAISAEFERLVTFES